MKKSIFTALALWLTLASPVFGQYTSQSTNAKRGLNQVYRTTWADGVITGAGIGLTYWGLTILQDKDGLSDGELANIDANLEAFKADIPKFDRWVAGNFSEKANRASDIPFYGSFALPFVVALSGEKTRGDFWQIGLLYVETMAITGTLFTHVAGRTERNRPLVYNSNPENGDRFDRNAEDSFFAGHTSATAAASFFAAKVFNDYYPNSKAKPFVWAGAIAIPATVGYLRLRAGKHFLSDNLLGYGVGAATGILVPHLHKISKNKNYTLLPVTGPYDGFVFQYKF